MKKKYILSILICCNILSVGFAQKPNIVYILADDLGIGDVSSYNPNGKIQTENIDKLAQNGVRFTDAHTTSAVCTPTRYSIMTGRYNWRTTMKKGVLHGYDTPLIDAKRETVGSFLQKQGYKTGVVGKWHLGWTWNNIEAGEKKVDFSKKVADNPNSRGFDYSFCIPASLDMPPYAYVENGFCTSVPKDTCEGRKGIELFRAGISAPDFKPEDVIGKFTEKALSFINQNANKDKPFFLYFPLAAPHTPVLPIGDFVGKSKVSPYGDFVLMVDDVVKQVVATLKKNGIYDNTIIIFTSDNGFANSANLQAQLAKGHNPSIDYRGLKTDIFEGGHRVPFIVHWGNVIKKGKVSEQLVCSSDLFRTVAELNKARLGDNVAEDSYSFLSEITDKKSGYEQRASIIHHSSNGYFAIRKGPWKLIMCSHSGGNSKPKEDSEEAKKLPPIQLYNLKTDLDETNNVYAQYPEIVKELTALLTKHVQDGRSTKGQNQTNDGPTHWSQLNWLGK
ncbi:arylsulfatase [Emticicia sp. BO119]|uniref:sulfatase family protein n=1 Tax=Emticicia sp. BO119 TaxID=2757768 RepID=UPI0015F0C91E|nr:arylsulfatase [Emticicia sp. BO119]MBA4850176.1 arylsulfatase [Emticicia sp. BO119]